jgi:hypothetical protein
MAQITRMLLGEGGMRLAESLSLHSSPVAALAVEVSFNRLSAWHLMQRQTREPRYCLLLLIWIYELHADAITRVEPCL